MSRNSLFGIIVPLFAIHSQSSCYRGDFADLKELIKIIASFGGTYLQLLPIQDTDGILSPYSLVSWFAIDPRYLRVDGVETTIPLPLESQLERKREKLFELFLTKKSSIGFLDSLHQFQQKHPWVLTYACFKFLKYKFNHLPFWKWDKHYQNQSADLLAELQTSYPDPIHFETYIQMTCFEQLEDVAKTACEHGVHLCCDLPHFCQADTAEGWSNPQFFVSHYTAGAPPDALSAEAQNWGLIPWNWQEHYSEVLQLWQERNALFSPYFSYARIDHAIGLFRQWMIEENKHGKEGHFRPADLNDAIALGKNTFHALSSASPTLIAENLGTIPPEVNQVLAELKIMGTIVWRWNRDWHAMGSPFITAMQTPDHNLFSMTTHDTSSIEGWARSAPEEFKLFCQTFSLAYPNNPTHIMIDPELRLRIFQLMQGFPCKIKAELIEEFLLLEEGFGYLNPHDQQVNDPANPQGENWIYRCKIDLETLAASSSWKQKMEKIIASN